MDPETGSNRPKVIHRNHDHEESHSDSHEGEQDIAIDTEEAPRTHPSSLMSSAPIKRSKRNPSVKCPICHEIVTPGQYQQHYRMELAQLESCISHNRPRVKRGAAIAATKQFSKGKSRGSASDNEKRDY
ncbi:hypothetical protein BGX21_001429 [Mortierella sp. AD011]|nr:hypothetical protein BGX20_004665 [Mortierella sp. AD010]KAF9401528.1 hypothetical protein BGX21_001429 [Mortierella sp. AD011]